MTFQPFSVNCLTCGSTLRVTDPAIVGTIASCPKCESMVQIDQPTTDAPADAAGSPSQVAVGQSSIDSGAITKDAIAPADLTPAKLGDNDAGSSTVDGPFAGNAPPPNPTTSDQSVAVPPPPAWQSQQSARTKQVALIASLSIGGLIAAAAAFGWFVSVWQAKSKPPSPIANVTAPPLANERALNSGEPELHFQVAPSATMRPKATIRN